MKSDLAVASDRQALVERILMSQTFHRAARLRELLTYIATHTTHPEELSEQQIGTKVFGRAETYNPAEDNIVRASARQLRAKLKEYFETEGLKETVILDIPKGGYQPVFTVRPIPAPPPEPVLPPPTSASNRRWVLAAAMLAALAGGIAVERFVFQDSSHEPASVFGQFLKQSPGPVHFVLNDSALAVMTSWRGSPVSVDDYANRGFVDEGIRTNADDPRMQQAWRDLSRRQITSLADVGTLVRLLQTYPSSARRIETRHARHMQARDLKSGNFILTSSQVTNPWASLFDAGLNFQFEADHIVNRKPATGELTEYRNEGNAKQWSRIALVKNLSGSGWVLLVAGLRFESTEGAGEFLLRPDALTEVRRALEVSQSEPLPPFELLLETKTLEGTSHSSRLAAWRRY